MGLRACAQIKSTGESNIMATETITPEHQLEINKATLSFWRDDCGVYEGLALGVDAMVDAGEQLNKLGQGILSRGLTQDDIDFAKSI